MTELVPDNFITSKKRLSSLNPRSGLDNLLDKDNLGKKRKSK